MTRKKGFYLLLLALFLGAALRVPGWFTDEEMKRWGLYEVDEEQHVSIMMHRFNKLSRDNGLDTIDHSYHDRDYNVQGYGRLNAALLYAGFTPQGDKPVFSEVLRFGRQISTLYALLLMIVVFQMGKLGGLSPPAAGVAALLMAACDVNATYSHYALPASGYIFFSYLALYGGMILIRRTSWWGLIFLAIGAGGAIGFKYDVFPMVTGGSLLLALTFLRGRDLRLPWYFLVVGICILLSWIALLWTGWSWADVKYSFDTLSYLNQDAISVDNHFFTNAITYPSGVLAGIGLPAFCLAVWSAWRVVGNRLKAGTKELLGNKTLTLIYVGGFLCIEAFLRWYMDTTFIRRVNIFMPAVALLAAWGLHRLNAKPWITALVIAWSFGLGVVGQSHHWFDTRSAARDWANENLPKPIKVGVSGYVMAKNFENWRYYKAPGWEYFVLHESWYARYTSQTMATPFKVPKCSREVYNSMGNPECDHIQRMVLDQRDDVVFHKAFRTWDIFPERLLYHHFFGYYETFLGDVVIYRRVKPKRGELSTS